MNWDLKVGAAFHVWVFIQHAAHKKSCLICYSLLEQLPFCRRRSSSLTHAAKSRMLGRVSERIMARPSTNGTWATTATMRLSRAASSMT